jgi:threonine dehydrogenase-like Zn-dependent dehydrogenase
MFEGSTNVELPRFAGHEVSGFVEEVGADVNGAVQPGDRVALYAEGEGFADFVRVPAEWAVVLEDNVPFDLALGEPIACAVNGVRKTRPELGDSVCIVGCGFMGLVMLQVFRAKGVGPVIAVDTRDSMLDLAIKLGADHSLNPTKTDIKEAVMDLTSGKGVDIGVEGAGIQATLDMTAELVRMEGKLEVFGFHQGARRTVDWGYWNWMAFDVVNGHTRTQSKYVEGMRIGLDLLAAGKLDMASLVTHRFDLSEINKGFETAVSKPEGYVKGVVVF